MNARSHRKQTLAKEYFETLPDVDSLDEFKSFKNAVKYHSEKYTEADFKRQKKKLVERIRSGTNPSEQAQVPIDDAMKDAINYLLDNLNTKTLVTEYTNVWNAYNRVMQQASIKTVDADKIMAAYYNLLNGWENPVEIRRKYSANTDHVDIEPGDREKLKDLVKVHGSYAEVGRLLDLTAENVRCMITKNEKTKAKIRQKLRAEHKKITI